MNDNIRGLLTTMRDQGGHPGVLADSLEDIGHPFAATLRNPKQILNQFQTHQGKDYHEPNSRHEFNPEYETNSRHSKRMVDDFFRTGKSSPAFHGWLHSQIEQPQMTAPVKYRRNPDGKPVWSVDPGTRGKEAIDKDKEEDLKYATKEGKKTIDNDQPNEERPLKKASTKQNIEDRFPYDSDPGTDTVPVKHPSHPTTHGAKKPAGRQHSGPQEGEWDETPVKKALGDPTYMKDQAAKAASARAKIAGRGAKPAQAAEPPVPPAAPAGIAGKLNEHAAQRPSPAESKNKAAEAMGDYGHEAVRGASAGSGVFGQKGFLRKARNPNEAMVPEIDFEKYSRWNPR